MSERSGTASAASSAAHGGDATKRAATIAELVARAHTKLSHAAPLSLTDHLKAAKALSGVRDRLATGDALDAKSRMLLLCTGVACYRRWSVGDADGTSGPSATTSGAADEAAQVKESEEAKKLVGETMSRIFVLICASERQRRSADERVGVVEEARATVDAADQSSVWSRMAPSRKRPRPEDGDGGGGGEDEDAGGEDDEEPSWERVMRPTTGEIARHALVLGLEGLEGAAFEMLDDLARLFFRSAGNDMTETLLMPSGDENVVSLSIARPMAERSEAERTKRLSALAMAAESEAGQSVIRDLLLSFLLPSSHVGVRRTLLLTRASSTRAGVDFPELVARAHEVAMAGSEWIWCNGTDALERMCCLLAGLAVLTTKGQEDPIRKADAFGGRLKLPFLETPPPAADAPRVVLIPSARRWVLHRIDARGRPVILCSLHGFEGFCDVALQLMDSVTGQA